MQRRSAIAVAGAVTGVLIAGSVASVAVINAASSSTISDEAPIVAADVIEQPTGQIVESAPGVEPSQLPTIVIPEPIEITAEAVTDERSVAVAEQPTPTQTASQAEVEATTEPVQVAPSTISARQARQAATAATPGTVLATSRVEHSGYDAYAVQIERADGSVVTGYVEATSGVVFDWVIDKKVPAPTASYADDDDYEDDRDDDDDHDDHDDDDHDDDDDDDDDEYEDDDRDGDDD